MGMTVLTAVVMLNPRKESKTTSAASASADDLLQAPSRPAFLDEPLRQSVPNPGSDTAGLRTSEAPAPVALSSAAKALSSPSLASAPESERVVAKEAPKGAKEFSPRERSYQAALLSSLVPGGTPADPQTKSVDDLPSVATDEEQLLTLGDSIMRSALRQNSAATTPIARTSARLEQSATPSNPGAPQQTFWAKAAAATKAPILAHLISAGSAYTLRAGTVIPALLITAITSDLPGDIVGQVSRDVYDSRAQRILLIPKGSRLIGTYDNQVASGQGRLLVAWTRLILTDGRSMHLPGLALTDAQGNAGAKGSVDNHWRRVFGNALLLSALSAGIQLSQPSQATVLSTPSPGQVAAGAVGQELSTVAIEILRRGMGTAPTITIPAGQAFNVLLNGDIVFDEPYVPRP
jgi:type IV secretion system protein VirB10